MKHILSAFFLLGVLSTSEVVCQTLYSSQPNATDGKDALIGYYNHNYSTSSQLNYGTGFAYFEAAEFVTPYTGIWIEAIDFDMSSIPEGSKVVEANLYLYYTGDAALKHKGGANSACYLKRILSDWGENTINWANRPAARQNGYVVVPAYTTDTQNYKIDVTDLMQELVNLPESYRHGFYFEFQNMSEIGVVRQLCFGSSDHATAAKRPKLEISYLSPEQCKQWEGACDYVDAIGRTGNVGVGVTAPTEKFEVGGGNASFSANVNVGGVLTIGDAPTTNPDAETVLAADGTILAKRLRSSPTYWSDHVFKDGYELMSLDALRGFIAAEGHLPNIPTEGEVATAGIDHGEMDAKLLEKVEELTLYILQMEEKMARMEAELAALKRQD